MQRSLKFSSQKLIDNEGKSSLKITPAIIAPDSKFKTLTYKRQQLLEDNTCGYWSIYNALMLILQGSETFWHEFFQQDSSEDETKYNAGLYLRTIFNKIASVSHEELEENINPGESIQGAEHTDSRAHDEMPKTSETQEIEGNENHTEIQPNLNSSNDPTCADNKTPNKNLDKRNKKRKEREKNQLDLRSMFQKAGNGSPSLI